jgi:cephalosporin-C deacetylase-like acetyl esterase
MHKLRRAILAAGLGLLAQPWTLALADAPAAHVSSRTVLPVQARAGAALTVRPDHDNWLYALGERAELRIEGLPGTKVSYRLGAEQFEGTPVQAVLPEGGLRLMVPSPAAPGFVRCTVTLADQPDAKTTAMATIGFSPERIVPTQAEPTDFDEFWRKQKAMLDAVPPEYTLTPAPKLSNDAVEVFYLRYRMFSNWSGPSYFFGVLSVPRGPGPYPVALYLPGAGVRPYFGQTGMARKGVITLELGVHGIALDYPEELYQQLGRGVLNEYNRFNLDDRDRYYFRRIYLGVMRGADYLASHPKWNGKQFIVTGGSQGGQLSMMLAGFDKRITGVAAAYPAYSDVTGYLHGRAGGWPALFKPTADGGRTDEPVEPKRITTGYYDSVNFARRIRVPGHYFMGFNDTVTPPTSVSAAFNTIKAPTQIVIAPEQGHAISPAQQRLVDTWILQQFGLAQ